MAVSCCCKLDNALHIFLCLHHVGTALFKPVERPRSRKIIASVVNMTGRGIVILSPFFSPNIGGVETHLNDLCNYLSRNGYRTYVFTYQPLTTDKTAASFEKSGNLETRRMKWFGYSLFDRLESNFFIEFLYLTPALFIFSLPYVFGIRKRIGVIHSHGLNAALVGI